MALSGGGSRAALFGAAGLEALGRLRGRRPSPPLVGPITFRVGEQDLYWHTGAGGLYENQGLESLLFVFLKQLQARTARRALIIAFDSSYPFAVGERRLSRRSQPFSLWTYDFSRIPSIMEQRASTYQALFFPSLQIEGVFPDNQTIRVVQLRHTDAEWQPDLSDLPKVCRQGNPPLDSPTAVVERLAEIPMRFWLASECDRQLLAVAAVKVVAQHQQEILTFLEGPAGAWRRPLRTYSRPLNELDAAITPPALDAIAATGSPSTTTTCPPTGCSRS